MSEDKVKVFLERVHIFLEDGNWSKADEYCEKILDIEPKNAEAYLCKLMVSLKVKKQEELKQCDKTFEDNLFFKKVECYGDDELVSKLKADVELIKKRNEEKQKAERETRNKMMLSLKKIGCIAISIILIIVIIVNITSSISDAYKYKKAVSLFESEKYEDAVVIFSELEDYKESEEMIEKSQQKIKETEEKAKLEEEAKKEQERKEQEEKEKQKIYDEAEEYLVKGDKANAAISFGHILGFKDAREKCFDLWDEIADRTTVDVGILRTIAVKNNGTVVIAGADVNSASKWASIIDVSASNGSENILALKSYGSVEGYGGYYYDVNSWENIVQVAAGPYHGVGLRADGTVVSTPCRGADRLTQMKGMTYVSSWKNIISVKTGYNFTVGLRANGTVVTTSDYFEKLNSWTDIVAISAGDFHVIGLKSDGTVVADSAPGISKNGECDVSEWKDIVKISAGNDHSVGITSNGTVIATRYKDDPTYSSGYYGQCNVSGIKNAVAVATGPYNTVVLKSDGTVVAVGSNSEGQCNVKSWKDIMQPKQSK